MTNHENLVNLFDAYLAENDKFQSKGNKAAGTRARKALAELSKATKERRKDYNKKLHRKIKIKRILN